MSIILKLIIIRLTRPYSNFYFFLFGFFFSASDLKFLTYRGKETKGVGQRALTLSAFNFHKLIFQLNQLASCNLFHLY